MAGIKGMNKGNQNSKGKGRQSLYAEKADAELLWKIFTEEYTLQELKDLMKGKRSVLKSMIIKAVQGNERFTEMMFKKLFPDNLVITGNLKQRSMESIESDVRAILKGIKKDEKSNRNWGNTRWWFGTV